MTVFVKRTWEARVTLGKVRGKSSKTWNDEIVLLLRRRGGTWMDARRSAKDKRE